MNPLLKYKYDPIGFFQDILRIEVNDHHREIIKMLQGEGGNPIVDQRLILKYRNNPQGQQKFAVIVIPRGHGKSFIICAYATWYITFNYKKQIVLISSCRDQSMLLLEQIKTFIKETEELNFLHPSEVPTADLEDWQSIWNRLAIYTSTQCKLLVRPFNSSIRGLHVNKAICDDVLRDDIGKELSEERAKYLFNNVLSPIVQKKKGDLTVLGTLQSETDLLSDLAEDERKGYNALVLDSVDDNWEVTLWPSSFSVKDLIQTRERIGAFAFTKEYRSRVINSDVAWFNEKEVKNAISKDALTNLPRANCVYYLGIDVAMSESDKADFAVFTTVEYNFETGFYSVAHVRREKGLNERDYIRITTELDEQYHYDFISPEENTIGYGVKKTLEDAFPHKCEGFKTNRTTKPEMLGHLQAAFNTGTIKIPDNSDLITELLSFRAYKKGNKHVIEGVGAHDDMVMSLAIAYETTLEYGNLVTVTHI